ncbi:MAG: hypothetical protein KDA91_14955 [Planctomycetaceae bacterium]|nr:hypothetical protein [Planctomycetaceae bacterium]
MRRLFISVVSLVVTVIVSSAAVHAQIGSPGIEYSGAIATGEGGQLYPYDQQDPWIHGQFQRVPAYGGFASFRPYNYRHVFSQTQIASGWGSAHGMPYSQQFWNRYRPSYLDGNLHSQARYQQPATPTPPALMPGQPVYQASFQATPSAVAPVQSQQPLSSDGRPIHVFPPSVQR